MMGFGESNAGCNPSASHGIATAVGLASKYPATSNLKTRGNFAN